MELTTDSRREVNPHESRRYKENCEIKGHARAFSITSRTLAAVTGLNRSNFKWPMLVPWTTSFHCPSCQA